jgi:hypothetical protein
LTPAPSSITIHSYETTFAKMLRSAEDANGSLTVYDLFTGQPASANDIVLDRLDAAQAEKWVAQFNLEFDKRAGGTIR